MGHPISLSPEALPAARGRVQQVQRPALGAASDHGPEDDRALARMLGASLLLGLGVTGGAVWGLWVAIASVVG